MAARGLTRNRLVTIAHDYVAEHGLDALTMRRLAAAAEVTPGALYKHFRDQRDLRRALADSVFAAIDLSDLDTAEPTVEQVIGCGQRRRQPLLPLAAEVALEGAEAPLGGGDVQLLAPRFQPGRRPARLEGLLREVDVVAAEAIERQ